MILIIAEKKLAAYAYARALSNSYKEHKGYLVGDNHITYSWAQGHLLQFSEPGSINPEWVEWNWSHLPINPQEIPLEPIPYQEKQLAVLKQLILQCSLLVNGMDCESEGERIFRTLIEYFNIKNKPIKRLWTASLQQTAIREAFYNLREHHEFDDLGRSAMVRGRHDYLLGINSSRSLTLAGNGDVLPMGRLIASVLALVHKREEIRNSFEEESYFAIKGQFRQKTNLVEGTYSGERITTQEQLSAVEKLIKETAPILSYTDKVKEQYPPTLLNHTAVLVTMNQRHGLKPYVTSKILESLYLKGFISYPRTNAFYVTKDEIVPMRAAYRILSEVYPNLAKGGNIDEFHKENDRLVNEVSDHHAIIPTPAVPKLEHEDEKLVYQLIVERFFLQAQLPKKSKVRSLLLTYNDKVTFKKSQQITIEYGWKGLDLDFSHEENIDTVEEDIEEISTDFPPLEQGSTFELIEHTVNTRKTNPPAAYTEGTLMKQMENIANAVDNVDYRKILKKNGLGTSATRAETIKKLEEIEYLALEKKKLYVTDLGEQIMKILNQSQETKYICSIEMTAHWEQALDEIRHGGSSEAFEEMNRKYIEVFIQQMKQTNVKPLKRADAISCPLCNGSIISTKKTYKCNQCEYFIWRVQFNKELSRKMLEDILNKGETTILTFTNKQKTKYKARLKAPVTNGKLQLAFENKSS